MSAIRLQYDVPLFVVDLITTDTDKKYEPAGRMAMAIIDITKENGGCLPQDLNARGFTPDDVANNWHLAKSLADVELNLMAARPVHYSMMSKGR